MHGASASETVDLAEWHVAHSLHAHLQLDHTSAPTRQRRPRSLTTDQYNDWRCCEACTIEATAPPTLSPSGLVHDAALTRRVKGPRRADSGDFMETTSWLVVKPA